MKGVGCECVRQRGACYSAEFGEGEGDPLGGLRVFKCTTACLVPRRGEGSRLVVLLLEADARGVGGVNRGDARPIDGTRASSPRAFPWRKAAR